MKINLRIVFVSGESKNVSCTASDIVKFEATFDLSIASLETQMKFTHLMYLAWASESRTKATSKSFEEWVDDVEVVEASEADPK